MDDKMKPLVTPEIRRLMKQIERNILEREEREGRPTSKCPKCFDRGETIEHIFHENVGYEAAHIRKCECQDEGYWQATQVQVEEAKEIPWEIDGDLAKDRLRYYQDGKPALWLYPNGQVLEYHMDLMKQPRKLYQVPRALRDQLLTEARAAKRFGQPVLKLPHRRY